MNTLSVALILLAALLQTPPIADSQPAKAGSLTLKLPQSWEIRPEAGTLLTALSPLEGADDTFRENLRVHSTPVDPAVTIKDAFQSRLDRAAQDPSMKLDGQGELRCNGHPVRWAALSPKQPPAEGPPLTMVEYGLVYRGAWYSIKFMVETKKLEAWRPQFESILKGVEPRLTREERDQSDAYGQGAAVGTIVAWAIVAVLVFAGARALFRMVKSGGARKNAQVE